MVLLLLVVLCCGPGHSSSLINPIWYHSYPRTWQAARDHCWSEHGGDLLTVQSQAELDLTDMRSYRAWIGRVIHSGHFHWGGSKGPHGPSNWSPTSGNDCAQGSYEEKSMTYADCSHRHFFFCSESPDLFVPHTLSWSDAQTFCEGKQQKLSTLYQEHTHLGWSGSPVYLTREFPVWVGLHSNGGPWSWGDGHQSDYRNWASGHGSDPGPGSDSCVSVGSQSKSMSVHKCSDAFPFLCYKPSLVLLTEKLSWEEALDHCKNIISTTSSSSSSSSTSSSSYRLLSVDHSQLQSVLTYTTGATTDKVWVGLRFLAGFWFWSDGVLLPLPSVPSCPGPTLRCGALVVSAPIGSEPVIEACDCSEKLNLLCYDPDHWP